MNDKKLTDKELEVTPDDKIVAKMKKMVFVDDEDVIRTAIELARQDERKRVFLKISREWRNITTGALGNIPQLIKSDEALDEIWFLTERIYMSLFNILLGSGERGNEE